MNYDVTKHPGKWKEFCSYTYKQIEELMTGYGSVDILWLEAADGSDRKAGSRISTWPASPPWPVRIVPAC